VEFYAPWCVNFNFYLSAIQADFEYHFLAYFFDLTNFNSFFIKLRLSSFKIDWINLIEGVFTLLKTFVMAGTNSYADLIDR